MQEIISLIGEPGAVDVYHSGNLAGYCHSVLIERTESASLHECQSAICWWRLRTGSVSIHKTGHKAWQQLCSRQDPTFKLAESEVEDNLTTFSRRKARERAWPSLAEPGAGGLL